MRGHKVRSLQESQILPLSLQLLLLPPSQSLENRLGSFPELPLIIINLPWELLLHGIPSINSFLLPLVSPLSSSVPVTLPLFQSLPSTAPAPAPAPRGRTGIRASLTRDTVRSSVESSPVLPAAAPAIRTPPACADFPGMFTPGAPLVSPGWGRFTPPGHF